MSEAVMTRKATLIAWSDDLDKIYPTLILATTAAAYDVEVTVFVTFWGLLAFKKNNRGITGKDWMTKALSVMRKGGTKSLKISRLHMGGMGTWMMNKIFKKEKIASLDSLIEEALISGVKFVPCQMTMDAFGLKREDLIDGMGDPAGASTAINVALDSQINWFI
ncbi:MAG: DsrE/DsrF/DrsH-like family protein [Actinobacteria bacterium]|nr:DsrE/DsrF/DrsH-like family protein [Actinomycetota bacterium]